MIEIEKSSFQRSPSFSAVDMFIDESGDVVPDELIAGFLEQRFSESSHEIMTDAKKSLFAKQCPMQRSPFFNAVDMFFDESGDVVPDEVIEGFLEHLGKVEQADKKAFSYVNPIVAANPGIFANPRIGDEESAEREICYAIATLDTVSKQLTPCIVQAEAIQDPEAGVILTATPYSWWDRNVW
eukprot:CAMPEP_0194216632 /NCGR_PEP_ID=MMETSP0156-20130528/19402_1 /TAXON_ID=33649 /ORGANISM="Thalassionema nitzschioides, Strain L26-B" /LENGTH=182 /DNA_ID=CAMNT_0038945449 /DNA_START=80 /DNA_END=625 /DNA_ORIENTATION=+